MNTPCADPPKLAPRPRRPPIEHRHLRRGQRQAGWRAPQAGALAGKRVPVLEVVAESIEGRLEDGKRLHVRLLLRRVGAPRSERHRHVVSRVLRRLLNSGASAEHDQVRERDLLAAGLRAVEALPDSIERLEDGRQLGRVVDLPILLRRKANARTVRATPLVGATERCCRRPCGCNQLWDGQSRSEDRALERGDVGLVDQRVVDSGDRVLPDLRAPTARACRR